MASFVPNNKIKNLGLLPARIFRWIGKNMQALRRRALVVLKYLTMQISCYTKGYCYPSIPTIARECGYSVRSVQYALDELTKAQLVSIDRVRSKFGDWDHNYYRISADLVASVVGGGSSARASDHPPKGTRHDQTTTIDRGAINADKRDLADLQEDKGRIKQLELIRQMKTIATNAARGAVHGAG